MTASTRHRRVGVRLALPALVVAALAYGLFVGYLFVMAEEGDHPSASRVSLPAGARVLSEDVSCGSGGCATQLIVLPPAGMTPEELANAMGATPQLRVPGSFFDPRTVNVMAWPKQGTLGLTLDYFSQEYVP
ncbi:MAG: hypothetical protein PIR02_16295 [Microbacterium enclense]